MDSVTQAALGATIAGAIAGKNCNAKVLLAGAALGTLPDLDVVLDYGDDVSNTIKHRGFSHSLLLLPPFALLLSWLYCALRPSDDWSFQRVFALIASVLVTHPLLDAMTTYGTQLLWPIEGYFEVSNIFIIDPLYTLPLLIALIVALLSKTNAGRWCRAVVLISTLYLGWGYGAQQIIAERVETNLAAQNIPNQRVLITPTPFNTVLWRVVVMGDSQYWEGLVSLLDRDPAIEFITRPAGQWPLTETPTTLLGLQAFTHQYMDVKEKQGELIVSDLRLGMANNLAFEFVFARRDQQGQWQLLDAPERYPSERGFDQLAALWQRLKGDQTISADLQISPQPQSR
ncbi:metal-dependent hydrolase [Vibrio sp. JPW-9-11-11]|uniref:metal-dependent hydrolase n=1 Tax=Vibrio sp. JPW-9-11-11 TaxID=1416532 RepID=UPI00159458B8|nr:metal-dependent hydrolase [Vibrio sp. JPW-9-11-11]NVD06502.1 metal-dependent hydrolase [Vibrio sp. JPW-9-11-11]